MVSSADRGESAADDAVTVVAAFDFDRTLTHRDSVVPFLVATAGRRRLALAALRSPFRVLSAVGRRDRDALRAVATTALHGRGADDLRGSALDYAAASVRPTLRSDTVARLAAHRAAGHLVVVVSASYEEYLAPIADELGCDAVLSTRLAFTDGACSGALDGSNCRGPEKVRRLEEWLDARRLDRAAVEVYAYGDSAGDREMLAWADHPVWVGADPIDPRPQPTVR